MNSRTIASMLLALTVTGCAGWNRGAPSCDGSAKRPLNKSLWDWEAKPPAAPAPALPPVQRLGRADPIGVGGEAAQATVAWTSFDIAGSLLPCGEGLRRG